MGNVSILKYMQTHAVTIFSFLWCFLGESVNTISIDLQVNLKNAGAPLKNSLLNVFFSSFFPSTNIFL